MNRRDFLKSQFATTVGAAVPAGAVEAAKSVATPNVLIGEAVWIKPGEKFSETVARSYTKALEKRGI